VDIKHETPYGTVEVPEDLTYNKNHVWVRKEDGLFVIGWTEYAVQSAGDVSYITLPKKGTTLEAGKEFGSVETGKWVGRLVSPITGEVAEINEEAMNNPQLVNDAPFSEGWFLKIRATAEPPADLLTPESYMEIVKAGKAF
jgi:glycine cleavage system H protein